jgi:rubrerythrin
MSSLWKKITGGGKPGPEDEAVGQYGADYVGVSDLMKFNQNLLDALRHEQAGLEFYRRFLEEANDERGREMYRRLIEEEERHLRMLEEEIDEHKKAGYWS